MIDIRMIFNVTHKHLTCTQLIIIGSRSETGRFVIVNPCFLHLHLFTFTCIGLVKSLRYHTNRF